MTGFGTHFLDLYLIKSIVYHFWLLNLVHKNYWGWDQPFFSIKNWFARWFDNGYINGWTALLQVDGWRKRAHMVNVYECLVYFKNTTYILQLSTAYLFGISSLRLTWNGSRTVFIWHRIQIWKFSERTNIIDLLKVTKNLQASTINKIKLRNKAEKQGKIETKKKKRKEGKKERKKESNIVKKWQRK